MLPLLLHSSDEQRTSAIQVLPTVLLPNGPNNEVLLITTKTKLFSLRRESLQVFVQPKRDTFGNCLLLSCSKKFQVEADGKWVVDKLRVLCCSELCLTGADLSTGARSAHGVRPIC